MTGRKIQRTAAVTKFLRDPLGDSDTVWEGECPTDVSVPGITILAEHFLVCHRQHARDSHEDWPVLCRRQYVCNMVPVRLQDRPSDGLELSSSLLPLPLFVLR